MDSTAAIIAVVTNDRPIQGELQLHCMTALWRLGEANVEQVRTALPKRSRGAYTTVQTVLNRLVERGLLSRTKTGNSYTYKPLVSESEYLSRSIEHTLSGASAEVRQVALAQLLGGLDQGEWSDLRKLARKIERGRKA